MLIHFLKQPDAFFRKRRKSKEIKRIFWGLILAWNLVYQRVFTTAGKCVSVAH